MPSSVTNTRRSVSALPKPASSAARATERPASSAARAESMRIASTYRAGVVPSSVWNSLVSWRVLKDACAARALTLWSPAGFAAMASVTARSCDRCGGVRFDGAENCDCPPARLRKTTNDRRDLADQIGAVIILDEGQGEVDTGRDAGRCVDVTVANEDRVGFDSDRPG